MKYTVIIPAVHGAILNRCLKSMAAEVLDNTIVYKNAPDTFVETYVLKELGDGVNRGISTAWNVGRQHVIDNNQDYLIICSQNNVFSEGMLDFIQSLDADRPKYGVWSNLGWHLMALSRETLEKCGEFDTNLFPAYYEDSEYAIRLHKLDMIDSFYEIKVKAEVESGFSTTLGIRVNDEALKQYVIRKWGDTFSWVHYHDQKFYEHPFNKPENSLTHFDKRPTEDMMNEYGYIGHKVKDLYVNSVKDLI